MSGFGRKWSLCLGVAKASIQLCKSLSQDDNIFRARGLKLPSIVLGNVFDCAGFNALEEL
jgi:hypothetical protein